MASSIDLPSLGGATAPYTLTIDGFDDDTFVVESFRGLERMSKPYAFDVVTALADPTDDTEFERQVLGQSATLAWQLGDTSRGFTGVIAAATVVRGEGERAHRRRFRLVPRLWLLKHKRKTRIFQNLRVPDVVTQVLTEAGIATRWQLSIAYPVRAYCTQYEETDYRFITRLLAEAGIYFYFAEGPPASSTAGTVSDIMGAAGGAAASAVGSLAGSAVGAAVGDAVSAASPLIPGDTIIFGDDSTFYPALGPDDAGALAAATAAAMAPAAAGAIGSAVGGLGAQAGAVVGGASAVAGQVIGAIESSSAPSLGFLDGLHSGSAPPNRVWKFDLETRLHANSAYFRDYDPSRPMSKLQSQALSDSPFTPTPLEAAAGAVTAAGSAVGQFAPGVAGDVGAAVASNAGAAFGVIEGLAGEHPPPTLEIYDHHGHFLFPDWSFGDDEAPRMLRQERRRVSRARGLSGCVDLASGHRFALTDHPVDHLNQTYVATAVEHRGVFRQLSAEVRPVYENSFECAPAATVFVPPRPRRRTVQSTLTAVVVGPKASEIYVDESGQIKVQFHWDRDGKNDEKSSCWIRTMHPWSGPAYGVQFIPRVGMEVVVVFEGGDPDKPMVIGSVYNGTHPLPYALPANKTQSGWKTNSSPTTGGYNELMFEDAAGSELVRFQAEKDLASLVKNDETRTVGNCRATEIGRNDSLAVGKNLSEEVAENHTTAVGQNQSLDVGVNRTTQIGFVDSTTVGKTHVVTISPPEGSPTATATMTDKKIVFDTGAGATIVLDKDTITLQANYIEIIGKLKGISLNAPAPQGKTTMFTGDSFTIDTKTASITTSAELKLHGATVSVDSDGELTEHGATVSIKSDGNLEVNGSVVDVKGKPIKLNC